MDRRWWVRWELGLVVGDVVNLGLVIVVVVFGGGCVLR